MVCTAVQDAIQKRCGIMQHSTTHPLLGFLRDRCSAPTFGLSPDSAQETDGLHSVEWRVTQYDGVWRGWYRSLIFFHPLWPLECWVPSCSACTRSSNAYFSPVGRLIRDEFKNGSVVYVLTLQNWQLPVDWYWFFVTHLMQLYQKSSMVV